jgi:hypothetical protein
LIRSNRIQDRLGLNWTAVVAVSEASFMDLYKSQIIQGVVVGSAICLITVYILSIFLSLSANEQMINAKKIAAEKKQQIKMQKYQNNQELESETKNTNANHSRSSKASSTASSTDSRRQSFMMQAKKKMSVDQTNYLFGGALNIGDEEEDEDNNTKNAVHLADLSPDSEEFFEIFADILRPVVESANLAMRIHR